MKSIIIEDEFVAAQSLERLIKAADGDMEIVAVLQTVEEAVEWFSENAAPDVAFMDIHLADGDSFAIFDKVEIRCPIIFTTAYDEYALKAFEVNSIDYLLKPITAKALQKSLAKFAQLARPQQPHNADMVAQLLQTMRQARGTHKRHFLIPHKDKFIPLAADEIAFVYAEFKMAKIVCVNQQSYTMDTSLDEFFRQLDPAKFFRANRQFIVSHRAINDLTVWFGGKLSINLTVSAPEKIIVSRARAAEFKEWFVRDA